MTHYTRQLFLTLIVFTVSQTVSAAESIGHEFHLHHKLNDNAQYMQLRLLGALELNNTTANNQTISELSGLAWDEDEQILYAISDQGYLVYLRPVIRRGILTDVLFIKKIPLLDRYGHPLSGQMADCEGLFALNTDNNINNDTVLLISFERIPRVVKYSMDGGYIHELPLPAQLTNASNYENKNRMLEAITYHPERGMIITSEKPLKYSIDNRFEVFDSHGIIGKYSAYDPDISAVTAMEYIGDNNFLMLERIYRQLFNTAEIILRIWNPDTAEKPKTLARLSPEEGFRIDNFEGLTHYRNQRYFIISDDNDNFLQKTLLLYFEIMIEKH